MNDSDTAAAGAIYLMVLGIIILISLVIAVIVYVLQAIGLMGLFRKAGVEPWKAWVPFYSTFCWLQLGGQNGHWMWLTLVPYASVVTAVFLYIGMYRTGLAFGKEAGFLVLGIFLPIIWLYILAFGKDQYRPELIAARGYGPPLIGYGSLAMPYGAAPATA